MDPQIIEIEPLAPGVQRKKRVFAVTFQAALWTVGMFFWGYLTHRSNGRAPDLKALIISCGFGGFLYALLMYFLPVSKLFRSKKKRAVRVGIMIERDQVTSSYQSSESTSWTPQIVVRKGMVRSIFKIPGGIGVSERGQFGARMLGFLVIPNSLPKFNELKSLLESWKVRESA